MQKLLDDLVRSTWWVFIIFVIMFSCGLGRIGHRQIPFKVRSIEATSYDGNNYIHTVTYENGTVVQMKNLDSYTIKKIKETGYMYGKYDESLRAGIGFASIFFLVPLSFGIIFPEDWKFGNPARFWVSEHVYGGYNYSTIVRFIGFFILLYYIVDNFFGAKHKIDFNEILRNIK